MVYTPTWKKNFILLCGLFENLVFTGKHSLCTAKLDDIHLIGLMPDLTT